MKENIHLFCKVAITVLQIEFQHSIKKPDVSAHTVVFNTSPLEKSVVNNVERVDLGHSQKKIEDKVQERLLQFEALSECCIYLDETDCKEISARRQHEARSPLFEKEPRHNK